MGDSPKPITPEHLFWGSPGSEQWNKQWEEIYGYPYSESTGEETGFLPMMDFIWDWADGSSQASIDKLNSVYDNIYKMTEGMPQLAVEMMSPYIAGFQELSKTLMDTTSEFDALKPKYETLWNQVGNQTKALNDDYERVKSEYANQYSQATANGPMTLNFGGTQAVLPNYKAAREYLAPQADIITQQSDLMNSKNDALLKVLAGQEALTANKLPFMAQSGNMLSNAANMQGDIFNIFASNPSQLGKIAEAQSNFNLLPLNWGMGQSDIMLGASQATPQQQSNWEMPAAYMMGDLANTSLDWYLNNK